MIEIFLQQRRKYHQKYDKVSSRSCISLYTFLSLSQELKVILLWFIQKLLRYVIFMRKNQGSRIKTLFIFLKELSLHVRSFSEQNNIKNERKGMGWITLQKCCRVR